MTINEFFENNNKAAIAYSGGVDSVYLLYAAVNAGADVKAYCVRSAFQPGFEIDDAVRLADHIGCDISILDVDVLSDDNVAANPVDRCYYCKRMIMQTIREAAASDGYAMVCDGTNASDDVNDRPGYKALGEFGIRSPLRECGLTKEDIRRASKEAGLDTWNKPAYACLATRIKQGERITKEKLDITEKAEGILSGMGFSDFRVRMRGASALVQIKKEQHARAIEMNAGIEAALKDLYTSVVIDEQPR